MSANVRARARGFTLLELMVVVIIIGIIAALAIPSMARSRVDRHAYDDAGSIMMLFREARTRAIARGGAVLIAMTSDTTKDRGTFMMYEAVGTNPGAGAALAARTPVASCKTPTVWTPLTDANTRILYIDSVNLNGSIEGDVDIETPFYVYDAANGATLFKSGFLCFTPLGRAYFTTAATPTFDGQLPLLNPLEFRVQRMQSSNVTVGTIRSVLVPPNGMARVASHT